MSNTQKSSSPKKHGRREHGEITLLPGSCEKQPKKSTEQELPAFRGRGDGFQIGRKGLGSSGVVRSEPFRMQQMNA